MNQRVTAYNASSHESAASISGAYQQHWASGLVTTNTYATELTQYLNYVSVKTSGSIDDRPLGAASLTCSVTSPCLVLHSGAILQAEDNYFGGTATTNYVGWVFDPDGVYTGNSDSQKFYLYYNGRLVDRNSVINNSRTSGGGSSIGPCSNCKPRGSVGSLATYDDRYWINTQCDFLHGTTKRKQCVRSGDFQVCL